MGSKCSLEDFGNLEFAIKEKYGEIAIINPKSFWNLEFEKIFQEQLKELAKCDKEREKNKKQLFKENCPKCIKCKKNLLDFRDKIYINKFKTCFLCYIKYVEGREELPKTRKEK